jgi:hypothetical protein
MSGRRNIWWARSAVFLLVLLLVDWSLIAGSDPTRASGTDIVVTDITSHTDGSNIGMTSQTVTALLDNDGTLYFSKHVNATLTVYYPANETDMSVVFSNTTYVGSLLGDPGNSTSVIFPQWIPSFEGFYALNVSIDSLDDHPGNNSVNITIRAMVGNPIDLTIDVNDLWKVIKPGESTSDPPNSPFVFRIRNDGLDPDSFSLDFESAWLEPGWSNNTGIVQPGTWSNNIVVNALAPADAKPPEFDVLVITATSDTDPGIFKQRAVDIKLYSQSGVSIVVNSEDPMVVYPGGEWVLFDFLVINTGDRADDYELEVDTVPTNWIVELKTSLYIRALEPGESRWVTARIRIPPLNYETMEEDNTYRGDTGTLVLKASSPTSKVVGTGEGHIYVGLVHTVRLEVNPPNRTLAWDPNVIQNVSFALNITSVNNIRNGVGIEMDVNLTLAEGKYGVLFYPLWDQGKYNETESKRWTGAVAPKILHLESGETSFGSRVEVTAPAFPFQGTAVSVVEATPLLGIGEEGLALPTREMVKVFVRPEMQFKVQPPQTDYYPEFQNGSLPTDTNGNSVPDWQEGAPGDILRLPFNITNLGNTADFYDIYADAIPRSPAATLPDDWLITYTSLTTELIPFWYDPLNPDHSILIWVMVRVPLGTPIGEVTEIKLEVTSIFSKDPDYRSEPLIIEASIDIYVIQGFGLDLEPEESAAYAAPDETIEYRLNITNIGNGVDTVRFIPVVDDLQGWVIEFNVSNIDLEPLDRHTVTLFVTPSITASADDVLAIKVRAESLLEPGTYDEVWINTTVEYVGGVMIDLMSLDQLIWRLPGEIATFKLRITNTGNGNDTFQLNLELGADKWGGVIDTGDSRGPNVVVDISRGASYTFLINISLPSLSTVRSRAELVEMNILAEQKIANYLRVYPHNAPELIAEEELTVGVLKQYKADIYLAPAETRLKDVLVGEEVNFKFILKNIGNGDDLITAGHSSPDGGFRHLSWTYLDSGPFDLAPFGEKLLNLSIEPDPEGLPLYGERIGLMVEAIAGNGVRYRSTNVSAQIVLSRILTDMTQVDLGERGEIVIRISNMPAPGTTPRLGFPDQKSFNISSEVDQQTVTGSGWKMVLPSFEVTLIDLYQIGDVKIPIEAPPDLLTNSEYASVNIEIRGVPGMSSTHRTMARAVYFDAGIDVHSTRFQNLYESRTGKAYIRLVTTGTRGQEVIPVVVMVGGEVIGEFNAGPAYPQDYGSGEQEIIFVVDFELPTLKWYEKGRSMELEVLVDPDNEIVENTMAGRSMAETNNELRKDFVIKNYTPHVAVLVLSGLMLLIAAVAGVIGFFYMDKKNSWYLLPLSIGLSGLFAMLFYVPLEESGLSLDVSNGFGLAIIAIDIFFIMPVMVYLYTRAGDSYILHLINTRRGREIVQGQEVTSDLIKPLLIALIGGLLIILIPVLYWVIPSEMNKGFTGILNAFFGFNGTIPVWVPVLLIPAFAVGLQMVMIQLKRSALKDIEHTWDNLERLKSEIQEGFK